MWSKDPSRDNPRRSSVYTLSYTQQSPYGSQTNGPGCSDWCAFARQSCPEIAQLWEIWICCLRIKLLPLEQ